MHLPNRRFLVAVLLVAVLASCSSATEPHGDVQAARAAWLTLRPSQYTFEVATQYSMFPRSGYYWVRVVNGQVVETRDAAGAPVVGFTLSIDSIWDRLLAARANGELNSVLFNRQGIPLETDMGPWELDGGVHYSVRRFSTGE